MADEIRKANTAHIGIAAALARVDKITSGLRSVPLFEHGTLLVIGSRTSAMTSERG